MFCQISFVHLPPLKGQAVEEQARERCDAAQPPTRHRKVGDATIIPTGVLPILVGAFYGKTSANLPRRRNKHAIEQ